MESQEIFVIMVHYQVGRKAPQKISQKIATCPKKSRTCFFLHNLKKMFHLMSNLSGEFDVLTKLVLELRTTEWGWEESAGGGNRRIKRWDGAGNVVSCKMWGDECEDCCREVTEAPRSHARLLRVLKDRKELSFFSLFPKEKIYPGEQICTTLRLRR